MINNPLIYIPQFTMYSNGLSTKLGIMNYNGFAENVYFDGIKRHFLFYNNEPINDSNSFNTADDVGKNNLNLL